MNFKIVKLALATILCCFMLLLSNCKKDPCETTVCNNAYCDEGICVCYPGYEGTDCSVEQRTKLLGVYVGTFKLGLFSQDNLSATLTKHPSIPARVIWDDTNYLEMNGSNDFLIPKQNLGSDGGTIQGSGSMYNNKLSMIFNYELDGEIVTCSYIGNR